MVQYVLKLMAWFFVVGTIEKSVRYLISRYFKLVWYQTWLIGNKYSQSLYILKISFDA